MFVEEIMAAPAICCSESDTLDIAARLMWEHDCGAIPVVDEDGRLRGMLTDRDICMACYTQNRPPREIGVAATMSQGVATCRPEDALELLENQLALNQVRRIPVIDGANRPIGMVSLSGIARHTASSGLQNQLNHRVVRTLAAICEPRAPESSQSRRYA